MTFNIPSFNFDSFVAKFADLVKIAEKLDCEIPTFEKTGEEVIVRQGAHGKYATTYFTIEVTGDAPKFEGWTFIASIDHVEGVVLGTGAKYPKKFHEARNTCDHCNTNRMRNRTFVVENDTDYRQVGGSCLKHYLGHRTPNAVASWFTATDALVACCSDSDYHGGASAPQTFDLVDVLIKSNHFIKTVGWVSKANADMDNQSTSSYVGSLFMNVPMEAEWRQRQFKMIDDKFDAHTEAATKALEWAKSLDGSDYNINLAKIAKNGFCTALTFGIAVSMMSAYLRHIERLETVKREAETRLPSEYVGALKERLKELELKIVSVRYMQSNYGTTTQLIMEDSKNNMFIWYASSYIEMEKGDDIVLTGTVKEHKEYNSNKQTALTRCKIKVSV